jgi:hypothetical protein
MQEDKLFNENEIGRAILTLSYIDKFIYQLDSSEHAKKSIHWTNITVEISVPSFMGDRK